VSKALALAYIAGLIRGLHSSGADLTASGLSDHALPGTESSSLGFGHLFPRLVALPIANFAHRHSVCLAPPAVQQPPVGHRITVSGRAPELTRQLDKQTGEMDGPNLPPFCRLGPAQTGIEIISPATAL